VVPAAAGAVPCGIMMLGRVVVVALAVVAGVAAAGCSDDAPAVDAAVDAPDDGEVDSADAGRCGASEVFLTGEYLDWDSTTNTFKGIAFATWTVRGQPARTVQTNPNGRVELCIEPGTVSIIDATATGYLPAVFVADPAVYATPGTYFTAKGITITRRDTFYPGELGVGFDGGSAQVLVQEQGTPRPLNLTPTASSFVVDNSDDLTWTAGDSGGLVLFVNVAVGGGTATLASNPAFVGPTELPLEAGTLTITSVRQP